MLCSREMTIVFMVTTVVCPGKGHHVPGNGSCVDVKCTLCFLELPSLLWCFCSQGMVMFTGSALVLPGMPVVLLGDDHIVERNGRDLPL